MAQALAPLSDRVQAVFNTTTDAVDAVAGDIVVAPRVPVLELLPRLAGVVCHGGLGTVTETLAHGCPLVIAPIRYDQPIVAAQVAAVGAGVRVRFGRATPHQLRTALTAILDDERYRAAACRVADGFAAAGGAPAAARHLARLAGQLRTPAGSPPTGGAGA
jgi:UDP:flavonoid glycosyltransferase YjiC (YdhE family)